MAVLEFVENDQVCRQIQLLKYFGEKDPTPCGKCSVCNKGDKKLSRDDMNEIYLGILRFLKNGPMNSREIVAHLKYSEGAIIKVLSLLCEKGVLDRAENNKYKILNK